VWRNPKYPQPDPPRPPEERGKRLMTLERDEDTELRLSLDEYQGHAYYSLRVWQRGDDGRMWPTRKGVSIRLREAPALANVLAKPLSDRGTAGMFDRDEGN
jgi:hypothetical protein